MKLLLEVGSSTQLNFKNNKNKKKWAKDFLSRYSKELLISVFGSCSLGLFSTKTDQMKKGFKARTGTTVETEDVDT